MFSPNAQSSMGDMPTRAEEPIDLEAMLPADQRNMTGAAAAAATSRGLLRKLEESPTVQKILSYPAPSTLQTKATSWLDGVRGTAALGVYIFHTMGCWAPLVAAWHADGAQTSFFQLPLVRSVFVAGGAAVSVFFVLSGYVLTYKSLVWMRGGAGQQVVPAVVSSMFRRGFRLYLPPVLLTFCEMLATRWGFVPPLNFTFVKEDSFAAQLLDWLRETNRLLNPAWNAVRALRGFVTHPKYDSVVWTMPLEFYGSFVCYFLLLLLGRVPTNGVRMGLVAGFACFCMIMGSWNMFCFSAGMLLADFNLGQEENRNNGAASRPRSSFRVLWTVVFAISFYIAGFPALVYPESKTKPMPGYETLRSLIPMSLNMEDHARFWWSISGVSLLLSISQLPHLKSLFETNLCQYLGKISFSLYLVHEFCLVLFGLRLKEILMSLVGVEPNANTVLYWVACAVWYVLVTVPIFAIAARVEKWVDAPSVRFARWLEGKCLKRFRSL